MTKQVLETAFLREDHGDAAGAVFVSENRGKVAEAVGATSTGVWRIRIISAGQGSSAFYPAAVLERDGRKAFPIGTKSYLNHPTMSDAWERPERDVEKICAKQVSEVEYDATDESLYANYQFGGKYQRMIGELYEVLGMSIYAMAEYEIETIGDFTGKIITSLVPSPLNSVDVVTVAGANGAIIAQVSEGFRALVSKGTSVQEATALTPQQKDQELDIKEVTAAIEAANANLVIAIVEALKPKAAEAVKESTLAAEHELVAESGLPKAVRAVVYKAIEGGASAADSIASQNILVEAIKADIAAEAALTVKATEAAAAALAAAAEAEDTVSHGRVLEAGATSAAAHLPKAWS